MKKYIIIFALLSICLLADAQKYLRYQMNDNTFNGFYTKSIENIAHDYKGGTEHSIIQTIDTLYEIRVDDIDSILIEDAVISDSNAGEYRIYEFNYEEEKVKKVYADNRACLFASQNGDFGANDTILFSSVYHGIKCLFLTDEQGRIKKLFDGNKLFYIDYISDEEFIMLDLLENKAKHYYSNNTSKIRRSLAGANSISFFTNLTDSKFINALCDIYLDAASIYIQELAKNINNVGNNPELRNQFLIVDGISIAGDVIGLFASVATEIASFGTLTPAFMTEMAYETGMLMYDINGLLNHLWPSTEQMNIYKEYYRNRYAINVKTIAPENVTSDKADLRGTLMSNNGMKGNLYFTISKLTDAGLGNRISGTPEPITSTSYIVNGPANGLIPGTTYFYQLYYECEVDGLHFTYYDNGTDFSTQVPSAITIGTESVNEKNAIVKCSFSNVPEGASCGIQYGYGDNSYHTSTSSSNGEHTVTLSGLMPSTTYYYRAYIQYQGVNYYGQERSFTTSAEEIPDLSGTWTFNQSYLGDQSVTMNLKLVNKGNGWASYHASGFYGVITFDCTVYSNRSVSLSLNALYGACGAFQGTFNESYTSVSGDSYIYCPGDNNWAVVPWTVNSPWSFSR